ncbi:MAG: ABC transporter ATP-binding protein [Micrococcus sp.]|nr:ABC transporter ATP-binding protein [Micrococcus sp.]
MLRATDITFRYTPERPVLDHVSLDVDAGRLHGLIGPNGSGKSTLIKLIANVLHSRHGSIQIDDHGHRSAAARQSLLYVASNDFLPEFLTGVEYLQMMHRLYGLRFDRNAAAEAFERYQMGGRERHLIEDYSHGMRKKTQLIAALLVARPVTIIDETLNGIDIDALYMIEKDLTAARDNGAAILLCSHDFPLLERTADRVSFLHTGTMLAEGTVDELSAEYGSVDDMVRLFVDATRSTP